MPRMLDPLAQGRRTEGGARPGVPRPHRVHQLVERTMDNLSSTAPAGPFCPACRLSGRILIHEGWVDYYHCDGCRTTWVIDKRHPQAVPIVIPPPTTDLGPLGR